jgi:hypothetical protein
MSSGRINLLANFGFFYISTPILHFQFMPQLLNQACDPVQVENKANLEKN